LQSRWTSPHGRGRCAVSIHSESRRARREGTSGPKRFGALATAVRDSVGGSGGAGRPRRLSRSSWRTPTTVSPSPAASTAPPSRASPRLADGVRLYAEVSCPRSRRRRRRALACIPPCWTPRSTLSAHRPERGGRVAAPLHLGRRLALLAGAGALRVTLSEASGRPLLSLGRRRGPAGRAGRSLAVRPVDTASAGRRGQSCRRLLEIGVARVLPASTTPSGAELRELGFRDPDGSRAPRGRTWRCPRTASSDGDTERRLAIVHPRRRRPAAARVARSGNWRRRGAARSLSPASAASP